MKPRSLRSVNFLSLQRLGSDWAELGRAWARETKLCPTPSEPWPGRDGGESTDFSTQRLDLPVAVSIFPGELFLPPRLWGERVYSRLFYWNEAAHGGHFAAFEQPAIFVEELRAAFRALPRGG
jgi:hypothetical protein